MNLIPRCSDRWRAPAVTIFAAAAVLTIFGGDSLAQSNAPAPSDAIPHLPYGVSPQESPLESRPTAPPKPIEPLGVTAGPAQPERAPLPRRKPPAKLVPRTSFSGVPGPLLVPGSESAAVPAPAPAPPNPLWDMPNAKHIGVEGSEELDRRLYLPTDKHGLLPSGSFTWLGLLGLLALGAVAIVLGQRGKRGEDQKRRRRRERTAY